MCVVHALVYFISYIINVCIFIYTFTAEDHPQSQAHSVPEQSWCLCFAHTLKSKVKLFAAGYCGCCCEYSQQGFSGLNIILSLWELLGDSTGSEAEAKRDQE